ncbi:MAG: virulence RhuM family protein [Bacilli bacterium]|nr:virulence RhuM family protein [Bacilli bacterium]
MNNIEIIKYKTNDYELDVRVDYERNTIWLNQEQIVKLFNRDKSVISRHIKNSLNELDEASVVAENATVVSNGKTYNIKYYNLEIIKLIGYKIDRIKIKEFNEWVIKVLDEYKKRKKRFEIVKFIDNSVENALELDVNVDPSEETVWLTIEQLSQLYCIQKPAIVKHIKNIYDEKELEERATVSKMEIVQYEGSRKVKRQISYYNLDMIISIGYRVNSRRGIIFRRWATNILKEYLIKGFVINEKRVTVTNDNYNDLLNVVTNIRSNQIEMD